MHTSQHLGILGERSNASNLTNKIDSTHFYSHRLCDPPRHRSVSQIKLCRKWRRPDDDHPASDTSTANLSVQPIFCPQQGGLISLLWDKISMYIEEYIVQLIFSCFGSDLGLKSCKTCRPVGVYHLILFIQMHRYSSWIVSANCLKSVFVVLII